MLKVCVSGATGATGGAVAEAVVAADDMALVSTVSRKAAGGQVLGAPCFASVTEALAGPEFDVLIDYTALSVVEANTRAAIAAQDAPVDRGDAIDWLETRLAAPRAGAVHLIYHTVAWQYFPAEAQARGTALIEAVGAKATADAPLAWLGMENDGDDLGAGLTLRLWPGDTRHALARVDFHGRWMRWHGL